MLLRYLAVISILVFSLEGQQQTVTFSAPPPSPVNNLSLSVVGTPGQTTSNYWVVARFPSGQSFPFGPVTITNSPNVLSGSNYIKVDWPAQTGATGYAVLRTAAGNFSVMAGCVCALTANTAANTFNDQGGGLSSFTVVPAGNATASIILDNTDYPQPRLVFDTGIQLSSFGLWFSDGTHQTSGASSLTFSMPGAPFSVSGSPGNNIMVTVGLSGTGVTLGTTAGVLTPGACLEADAFGNIVHSVSNVACGSGGGGGAFSAITSGTNTTAAMAVATGSTLGPSGSGIVTANAFLGNLPVTNLNSGTNADNTHFWRGDGVWATVPGGGTVTVVGAGNLCADCIVTGGGTQTLQTATTTATMPAGGNFSTPGTVTTGNAGGATGLIQLKGLTSGIVSVSAQDVAGTWTFKFPTGPGSANQTLITDGAGNTSWAGSTVKVVAGTTALGTSAIGSAVCVTSTTAATGALTTDTLAVNFSGDPTSTVGYQPSTNGMLTIIPYLTAGNMNFKVCNNTTGSITPGAVTLNWIVTR